MAIANVNTVAGNNTYSRWFNNKQNNSKYASSTEQGNKSEYKSVYEEEKSRKISEIKKLLNGTKKGDETRSILDSSQKYRDSLKASRNAAKNTAAELKQLKYNYKNISSQIRRSKTSVNAKQVASKARREVTQLKIKLQSGKYDEEELTAAIEHAKSMERAAKKKARHLEEEELIRITEEEGFDTSSAEFEQQMEEKLDELYEMISDAMDEMMEGTLEDLEDGLMMVTDFEMNEDEFNNYKLKHRTNEEKTMVEADAKYLKALFEIYDKKSGGGSIETSPVSSYNVDLSCVRAVTETPNIVDISL